MIVDNNTLIGVVAGSATAALCGYAYYLYRDKKKKENMRDKQCQVYQPTKRHTGTQCRRIITLNKEVQCRPLKIDKRVQFRLPMVSTATQADMDYEAQCMKDASCHVSLQDLGAMKSTASQTEGVNTHATSLDQIASSESLKSCKSDIFYDARESRPQSQEEVLNYEEVVPRTSSIMGHLKYMMGPFQSLVEANSQNAKKVKKDRTEEGSDMVLSRSQRSSIRSEACLEDVIECDSDDPATPF